MKIEHEIKDVQMVRYRTISEALIVGLGKHLLDGISNRILDTLHLLNADEESELSEVLHEPLWRVYEDEKSCTQTCALVSMEQEMTEHEFRLALTKNDHQYVPASISEAMSYLPVLKEKGIEVDFVFHLGTSFRTEKFFEQKILTRKNGTVELVPFYHATKLKPHYTIVVVKEEKKQAKK